MTVQRNPAPLFWAALQRLLLAAARLELYSRNMSLRTDSSRRPNSWLDGGRGAQPERFQDSCGRRGSDRPRLRESPRQGVSKEPLHEVGGRLCEVVETQAIGWFGGHLV